jgi:3-dehydroquinate dehydratase-1
MRKFPVAVAIPVTASKMADGDIRATLATIAPTGAQYVEFRIDYDADPQSLDLDELIYESTQAGFETILTCRIKAEGGQWEPAIEDEQAAIYDKMISAKPEYIDVELVTSPAILQDIAGICAELDVGIILSRHDFKGTPEIADAETYAADMIKTIEDLEFLDKERILVKGIFMARQISDNLFPLAFTAQLGREDYKTISFCMGAEGQLSRVLCMIPRECQGCTSIMTYAFCGEPTAPGQIEVGTMTALLSEFLD